MNNLATTIEERVAASGNRTDTFDPRPKRDVVNRRVWNECVWCASYRVSQH